MRYPIVLLGSMLLLGGCGSDKIECGTPPDIGGNWIYSGAQLGATLSGTMSLTSSGTCTFDGHISVSEDNGSGTPRLLDGGVSGIFLDDSTVDFTAQLDGSRRHLGTVRADSAVGSWSVAGPGGASGTFKIVRGPA